jgi:hypothetical protein
MKYLALLFVGLFVFVSAPVQAEEITMICYYDGETKIHKYVNPPIGFKKVLQRVEGEWLKWDRTTSQTVSSELKITNRGAILEQSFKTKFIVDIPENRVKKGDPTIRHERYVLDFEFLKRTVTMYLTKVDGTFFPNKKRNGFSPDNPGKEEWSCAKYDPSSSEKN